MNFGMIKKMSDYLNAKTENVQKLFDSERKKQIVEFIQNLKCLNPTYIMDLSDGDRKVIDYFWIQVLIEKYEEEIK